MTTPSGPEKPTPQALAAAAASVALRATVEACREDLAAFCEFVLSDQHGRPIKLAPIHRAWITHVGACWDAGLYPLVMAPFAHGKSKILVVALPAWILGREPNARIKVVCNSDDNATKRVMEIGSILSNNPRYKLVFPWIRIANKRDGKRLWTQREILVVRKGSAIDPSVQARGIFATGIGARADYIFFDDIVDEANAISSPSKRERVIQVVDRVWLSRLESTGKAVGVGTPWHRGDWNHEAMRREAWSVLRCRISDDLARIDMDVTNPPPDYPIERLVGP